MLAVEPHTFVYKGRVALFSMNILHDERVVVVAEQKPNCTDEEVSVLLPVRVVWWVWQEHVGCVVGVAET